MKKSIKRLPKRTQEELTVLLDLVCKSIGNCQMVILFRARPRPPHGGGGPPGLESHLHLRKRRHPGRGRADYEKVDAGDLSLDDATCRSGGAARCPR